MPIAVKDEIDCSPYPTTGDFLASLPFLGPQVILRISIFNLSFTADFVSDIVTDTCVGGTKWLHKLRPCKTDACCVARLRSCGAILVGKTNMHELGAGTSGINPHYGYYTN